MTEAKNIEVLELKSKMYDYLTEIDTLKAQVSDYGNALQTIVNILEIPGDEKGSVTLVDVVEAVKELREKQNIEVVGSDHA